MIIRYKQGETTIRYCVPISVFLNRVPSSGSLPGHEAFYLSLYHPTWDTTTPMGSGLNPRPGHENSKVSKPTSQHQGLCVPCICPPGGMLNGGPVSCGVYFTGDIQDSRVALMVVTTVALIYV